MSTYVAIDPITGDAYEVPGKQVQCVNTDCENNGISIEVPDDPHGVVVCGPCGLWIVPPSKENP